ncbi:MAG TPA: hypothetical protein VMG59_10820 [Phycisphaerae bacterium]|nr:hypothetical protein [Phycisphaerae bacterium]
MPKRNIFNVIILSIILAAAIPFLWNEYQLLGLDNLSYDFQKAFNSSLAAEPQFAGARASVDIPGRVVIVAPVAFGNLNPFIEAVDQLRENYPDITQIDALVRFSIPKGAQVNFYKAPSQSAAIAFCLAAGDVILKNPQYTGYEVQYLEGPSLVDVELQGSPAKQRLFIQAVKARYENSPSHPAVALLFGTSSKPFDVYFPSYQNPYMEVWDSANSLQVMLMLHRHLGRNCLVPLPPLSANTHPTGRGVESSGLT